VTIRRILLLAFLLVSLTPSVILTYLAFVQTRDALVRESESSLAAQAATLSREVDHMLFERLQNALSWSRLDVMQDLRIKDVDKRLSQFLAEVARAYGGVYDTLYCIDGSGVIVASSKPALIGTQVARQALWLTAKLPNGAVSLNAPQRSADGGSYVVPIRAPLYSASDGAALGELVLLFDQRQIAQSLDGLAKSGRSAVILDAEGRLVAASSGLRDVGQPYGAALRALLPAPNRGSGVEQRLSTTPDGQSLIVGFDRSRGYEHFAGFGWTTLALQSRDEALAAVRRMGYVFLGLLIISVIVTAALSIYVAGRISQPIARLTRFTQTFGREQRMPAPPPPGRGEVGELTDAFVTMVAALDRSRQDFLRASKLAVAGEIAATMAHEIRTPLGILRSAAQIVADEPALSSEGRELVGFIDSETERINRLVVGLLESANPHPPAFRRADLSALVRAAIAMLQPQADKKQIALTATFSGRDFHAVCDPEQMTQVLLNLLLNALQILPLEGRIAIDCRDDGATLRLEIGDSGPGISEADRGHIFEPFFSRRAGGLGLGLAVVRQIIVAHQGEIEIGQHQQLGGASFIVRIPHDRSPQT
jgi:signal transduction histidine kinase